MRLQQLKAILKAAASGAAVLLLGVGAASAQQVNLTAGPTHANACLTVLWCPCGATAATRGFNPHGDAAARSTRTRRGAWSPVVITVPADATLTIHLTNNLAFGGRPDSDLDRHRRPTRRRPRCTRREQPARPTTTRERPGRSPIPRSHLHAAGTGTACAVLRHGNRGRRDESTLTWTGLRPGTYLLESGTHPSIQASMGLIGVLVVTTPGARLGSPIRP